MFKRYITTLLLSITLSISHAFAHDITAQAWLVADENGSILQGQNVDDIRSIASITKLMTVMVVLDMNQPLDEVIQRRFFGTNLTRRQLIELAIVKSDNNAAKTLCEYYPNGLHACIDAMNDKAKQLYMYNTRFTDPTGLDKDNVSTASDLVILLDNASKYSEIVEDSGKYMVTYSVGKKRTITYSNTNPLVKNLPFEVSKTGFIRNAGGCVAMIVRTTNGLRTVIILGSKTIRTRIPEAHQIIKML